LASLVFKGILKLLTIPHSKLKDKLRGFVQLCFIKRNGKRRYLVLGRDRSYFVKKNSDFTKKFSETDIINMLDFFLLTTYLLSLVDVFLTRLTRRLSLVKQELLTLPEHMCSTPLLSGVRVTRSLVSYVCFFYRCLSFCSFSFCHCVAVPLRYTDSDCPFGVFKLFFQQKVGIKTVLLLLPTCSFICMRETSYR